MEKLKHIVLALSLLLINSYGYSQDVTTVEAKNEDISDNLDLKAVASVFGESKDLEDFEKRLNDPEARITNLDLNNDGVVDYLRVMETTKGNTHYIAIQSVIAKDQFQDVASIEVEKDSKGETVVQVVGDVYMYGPNYIYQPVYVHPPVFFTFFWIATYNPWRSPWYWGYHPPYYHPWRPYPVYRYHSNVHVHINVNNVYNVTNVRHSRNSINIQNNVRRNDFGNRHPNNSFQNRNKGKSNYSQLNRNWNNHRASEYPKLNGRKVDKNWKPRSGASRENIKTHKPDNYNKQRNRNNYKKPNTQKQPKRTVKPKKTRSKRRR
ncbi:MAG: hypothetical protein ABFR62_03035 [Bacteroidota bacterium]